MHIPWVLLTDGDYYEIREKLDEDTGEPIKTRKYHIMHEETATQLGYKGNDLIGKILTDLNILNAEDIPTSPSNQDLLFREQGCFVGNYTLEVDMMENCTPADREVIKKIYEELISGGTGMYENFQTALDGGNYWTALRKIENNISKGRFAQRLSRNLTATMIPDYITEGLEFIIKKVKKEYE